MNSSDSDSSTCANDAVRVWKVDQVWRTSSLGCLLDYQTREGEEGREEGRRKGRRRRRGREEYTLTADRGKEHPMGHRLHISTPLFTIGN